MNDKVYAYTLNNRVVWWDEKLQQIPVISEMYYVRRVPRVENVSVEDCTHYVLSKKFRNFEDELVHMPLRDDESEFIKLVFLKTKFYMKLIDIINCSYQAIFPAIFSSESDRHELLAKSLLDYTQLDNEAIAKHEKLVTQLVRDKKSELMRRYLLYLHQIKNAKTLDEVQTVGYTIVYNGINVI